MNAESPQDIDSPQPRPRRSWGLRFSLLSMILFMTVIALAISRWQLSEQLAEMKVRNDQLGKSLGIPPIHDPAKVTAIGVPVMVPDAWEWHLVIPKGKQYDLFVAFTHVPYEGLPENPIHVDTLTDGEIRFNLSIDKPEILPPTVTVRGHYVLPPQKTTTMLYQSLSPREASWLAHFGGESPEVDRGEGVPGSEKTKWYRTRNEGLIADPEFVATTFNPDEAIVLRRTRVYPIKESDDDSQPKTCAGMMVWLVPKEAEDPSGKP